MRAPRQRTPFRGHCRRIPLTKFGEAPVLVEDDTLPGCGDPAQTGSPGSTGDEFVRGRISKLGPQHSKAHAGAFWLCLGLGPWGPCRHVYRYVPRSTNAWSVMMTYGRSS